MSEGAIDPVPAGIGTESVPLKQRFYYYRSKVLRFRKAGFDADEMYWALRNQKLLKTIVTPDGPSGN